MKNLIFTAFLLLLFGCKTTNFIPSADDPLTQKERREQDLGFKKNFKTICKKDDFNGRIKGTLINGEFFPLLFKENNSTGYYYFSVYNTHIISNIKIDCTNPNIQLLSDEDELDSLSHLNLKKIYVIPRTEDETIKISSGDPFFIENFSLEYNFNGELVYCLNKRIYWDIDSSGVLKKSIMF
ncbi:MAG: hypothetical protein K1X55_16135 [Chitinophagales bacterium]|nr:hypothetical protein [Chitinophagales bacterium]